jgi:hypothetical protein
MNVADLVGADWSKVDPYMLNMLVDRSKPIQTYSGTLEGWVHMMVVQSGFRTGSVPFLIKIVDISLWPTAGVPGLTLYSCIENILAASGTFEAIVTLAKDPNVLYLEASRFSHTEEQLA